MSSRLAGSPGRDPEAALRPGAPGAADSGAPARWGATAWAAGCGVLLAVVLAQLVADASKGLDLTDEGLVLLGAQNRQPGAAFNGFSGSYLGALFAVVGHDVAAYRIAGAILLAAVGGALGLALARLLGRGAARRDVQAALAFATAAVSLGYYALYLRSPSYNWLALVGILLVGTGILVALAEPPGSSGSRRAGAGIAVAIGLGVAVALTGKVTTGMAAYLVAVAALAADAVHRRQVHRVWPVVGAGAIVAALIGLHLAFVLGPDASLGLMRRSSAVLAVIDPEHYTPLHAFRHLATNLAGVPLLVVTMTLGVALAGLLLLVPAVRRRLGRHAVAILGVGPVVVVGVTVPLVQGAAVSGWLHLGRYGLALAATAGIGLAATALALRRPAPVRPADRDAASPPSAGGRDDAGIAVAATLGALAMLLLAVGYVLGSNNPLAMQIGGAIGALAVAAATFTSAMPAIANRRSRTGGGRSGQPILAAGAVLTVVAAATVPALWGARDAPYREAPIESAVAGASPARLHGLLFDTASAAYWDDLAATATASGWQPGDTLLDLTWSPAVPWVLDARIPDTLTSRVGREATATASSLESIRRSPDVDWTRAWLLVSPDLAKTDTSAITASFGRPFPAGYERVGSFTIPFRGLRQELWRPRSP